MDDIAALVVQIEQYITRRGATLSVSKQKLYAQIRCYLHLRQTMSRLDISYPRMAVFKPTGWTGRHEALWDDWIHYTFSDDNWYAEVVYPVFGRDVRDWELYMDGWREELLEFLPWWIRRSVDIVEDYDPTPEESEDNDDLLLDAEHGSKMTRS